MFTVLAKPWDPSYFTFYMTKEVVLARGNEFLAALDELKKQKDEGPFSVSLSMATEDLRLVLRQWSLWQTNRDTFQRSSLALCPQPEPPNKVGI